MLSSEILAPKLMVVKAYIVFVCLALLVGFILYCYKY